MAEDRSRNAKAPALGVVGALVAIASIWWFALRPRRRHGGGTGDEG